MSLADTPACLLTTWRYSPHNCSSVPPRRPRQGVFAGCLQFITRLLRSSDKGIYRMALDGVSGADLLDCVVLVSMDRGSSPEQLMPLGLSFWNL